MLSVPPVLVPPPYHFFDTNEANGEQLNLKLSTTDSNGQYGKDYRMLHIKEVDQVKK